MNGRARVDPVDRVLRLLPNPDASRRIPIVFAASVAWHAHVNIETLPRTVLPRTDHGRRRPKCHRVLSILLD